MSGSDLLNKVADVLEKTASYFEQVESKKIAEEQSKRQKAATDLAEKISEVTGEEVETTVVEKLSKLDPEVSKFISKIAGDNENVDSLGGPRENEKKASAGGAPPADSHFLDWIVGP